MKLVIILIFLMIVIITLLVAIGVWLWNRALLTKVLLGLVTLFICNFLYESYGSNKAIIIHDDALTYSAGSSFVKQNCYSSINRKIINKTASGFELHIPDWVIHRHKTFNERCEIISIHLYFLINDGVVLPEAHSASGHPNYKLGFSTPDRVTLMMSFKKPLVKPRVTNELCENKKNVIHYPEYNLVMCPYLKAVKNSHLKELPYYPVFHFKDDRRVIASLTCSHSQLKGYSLKNILDLDVGTSCRGHWKWRPGAYIMFDISQNEILKESYSSLVQIEKTLNSWVVTKPNKKFNKDKKQLAFAPSSPF